MIGCALVWLAVNAWDQDAASQRLAIALTDPSRPGMVKVSVLNGSITVRGYPGKEVLLETDQAGLRVEEADNQVIVEPDPDGPVDLRISVPARTSLQLKCTKGGNIQVERLEGEIEAEGVNASITLRKITGVVVAHSLQGRVVVQMDKVTPGKPMAFSAMNGDVDVSLPADTRADVSLQTLNGSLHTDFAISEIADSRQKAPRRVAGRINGGGAEITLKTLNGGVRLRKSDPSHP